MVKRDIGKMVLENFSPLRLSNFRTYIGGQAISQIGTWLQLEAQVRRLNRVSQIDLGFPHDLWLPMR